MVTVTNGGTFTTLDDAINSITEEQRQQFCDLVSSEFFAGTLQNTLVSNFSCDPTMQIFPITVPSFFHGYVIEIYHVCK